MKFKRKVKPITIQVHPDFYNEINSIRKDLESQIKNVKFSQADISKMLVEGGLKLPNGIKKFNKKQTR